MMINISAPWDAENQTYRQPWGLYLSAQDWRSGELGEVCGIADGDDSRWSANAVASEIPICAEPSPTFVEATRPKEITGMLKCGRDNNCPLKVTIAAQIFERTSVSKN
jgi:hypothetical protein